MFKKIGSIMALILGGLLLVYSATRSLDFIKLTLPPERAIMAWFGLASLDGGLVSWLIVYLKGSRGWQRAVAFIMIIVDLVGAVAMFYADTVYNTGKAGLTETFTQQEMGTFVAALSGVIALNIAATVAFHMVDPDQLREQAEEEAFAKIEDKTLQNVSRNADRLASQLAPTLAADWMAQTEARYMAGIGTSKVGQIIDATAHDIPARSPAPAYMPVLADNPEPEKINPLQWMKAWAMSGKKKYEHATSAPVPTQANRGGSGSLPADRSPVPSPIADPAPAPVSAPAPEEKEREAVVVTGKEFTFTIPFRVWFVGRDMPAARIYHHGKLHTIDPQEYRIAKDGTFETKASYPFGVLTDAEIAELRGGRLPACFLREEPHREPEPRNR